MRGLKHEDAAKNPKYHKVAPLVGAWIETVQIRGKTQVVSVAPLVGAWIETSKEN